MQGQGLKAKIAARDERQLDKARNPQAGKTRGPNGLRWHVPADPTPKRERMARAVMPCHPKPRRAVL